ncbi:hypothetical protein, partial [Enterobacter cloacae complex sp. IR5459]|uniref:hypothetical protein n=1 Tax=Enterobacter cloacae complex sp. IR5459 TaxID=3412376 RepID=UPI003BA0D594
MSFFSTQLGNARLSQKLRYEALFPLGLLIPFLTEPGWIVETFTALVGFRHFAPDSFVIWQFACHVLLCA